MRVLPETVLLNVCAAVKLDAGTKESVDCFSVLVLVISTLLKSVATLDVYVKLDPFKSSAEFDESFPLTVNAVLEPRLNVPPVTARLERVTVPPDTVKAPVACKRLISRAGNGQIGYIGCAVP